MERREEEAGRREERWIGFQELELGDEHRGDAVNRGAGVGGDTFEGGAWIEGFGGEDDGGAVGCSGHVPEDTAETTVKVNERRGFRGEGVYWNKGGGQHTTSSSVRSMRSPMLFPLLRTPR